MTQTLRVDVPGPAALWTLTVDGAACPVGAPVPVAAGTRRVVVRLVVPGRADGSVTCDVDVPPGAEVTLSAPGVGYAC